MAMTACRECEAPLSDQADTCPACGVKAPTIAALQRRDHRANVYYVLTLVLLAAIFGGVLLYQHHQAEQKRQQQVCDFTHALGGSSC